MATPPPLRPPKDLLLYVGIPFCLPTTPDRCGFCLFPSEVYKSPEQLVTYLRYLRAEGELYRGWFDDGRCRRLRDKAVVALLGYGGLRRSEVVALDVGDYDADFGLRRVKGKGEHEAAVALPEVARAILDEYLERERPTARFDEPLFLVRYKKWPGEWQVRRMDSHRVWKLIKDMGRRAGVPELHPHAFRHACGVELLKRNGGNLRVVQEHLRHQDIGTTVTYTRIAQHDRRGRSPCSTRGTETMEPIPSPTGRKQSEAKSARPLTVVPEMIRAPLDTRLSRGLVLTR